MKICLPGFLKSLFFLIIVGYSNQLFPQSPYPAVDDEFVGPFPSWINVKTQYGAIGDGVADETAALQAAFNSIGNSNSTASVVYLPPGTYKITGTLTMNAKMDVAVIGADPATTKIVWAGTSGGTMFQINGTAYSRFNRITWDGNNIAGIAIDQSWNGSNSPGFFDTGNEYADDVFKDVGTGIRGGHLGYGFAETAVMRCNFIRNTLAGITLGNFNALDVWIWHSLFENCAVGVTNAYGNSNSTGAGNFKIYNSVFRNSTTTDIMIGNNGEFSFRDNTSSNSQTFIKTLAKNYPYQITLQSNTIIEPVSNLVIDINNHGPIVLMDNVIRSRTNATGPVIKVSSLTYPSTEFFSIGNTFTVSNPLSLASSTRALIYDNPVVSANSLSNLSEQLLPGTQPNLNRTIFEVPPGSNASAIQNIINVAASVTGTRPIVHFPHGTYYISSTLTIPTGSDMQLVGDGDGASNATILRWNGFSAGPIIKIAGPSKATLRDFSLWGNDIASSILMTNVDQTDGRVFMHQVENHLNKDNFFVNKLDNTLVLAYNSRFSAASSTSVKVQGGALSAGGNPQPGRTIIYGGLGWDNNLTHEVTKGGNLLVRDMWYESNLTNTYSNLPGSGIFTIDGSHITSPRNSILPQINLANFSGKACLLNSYLQDRVTISGSGAQTSFLGLGVVFGESSQPVQSATTTYIENNSSPSGGSIVSLNSRSFNNPNLVFPRYGSYGVNDIGSADSAFIATMIAPARNVHAQVLTALPYGITDVRLYRIWTYKGTTGIELQSSTTALPVKFVSLAAECRNGNVVLNWKTALEINTRKFDIEQSTDGGIVWKVTGSVSAAGNNVTEKGYNYTDITNNPSAIYRIVTYEIDGNKTISNIIRSPCASKNLSVTIHPNPVKNLALVVIYAAEPAQVELLLYDNKGSLVKKQFTKLLAAKNTIEVDMSMLVSGNYTLRTAWGDNVYINKIIKAR